MAETKEPIKGEHIFPNTQLTAVVLRWKELTAEGKHTDAFGLLEEIIVGSTPMFERLAIYEGFHHTVPLSQLIQAARIKVPAWLSACDVDELRKGKLFSWFSTSLTGDHRVTMEDGTLRRLDDLVASKSTAKVVSWNTATKKFEPKAIIDWHVTPVPKAHKHRWQKVSVKHPSGFKRPLFITDDHEVLTQRGWLKVGDLNSATDTLFMRHLTVTDDGRGAIIGMYLGDGHIRKADRCLVINHGTPQRSYTEHVAEKFGKRVYELPTCHGYEGSTLPYGVCVPLLAIWPDSRELLPSKKKITPELLAQANDATLAYWYMDDGGFVRRKDSGYVRLFTDGFSRKQCQVLQDWLKRAYGYETNWIKRKGKPYGFLYLLAKHSDDFLRRVERYLIPALRYKLPPSLERLPVANVELTKFDVVPCTFERRGVVGRSNVLTRGLGPGGASRGWYSPDFELRYDITVEDNYNFLAEGVVVHNCCKNVYRSEANKMRQHTSRFHATSDTLEKFVGEEDHMVNRHDAAAEAKRRIQDICVRWNNPQEFGAVKYAIDCLTDEGRQQDKVKIVAGISYAYGLSSEMAKFFYQWALFAMRDALYDQVRAPFSRQDALRIRESYTFIPDMIDIVGWDRFCQLVVKLGGSRIKLPTTVQLARVHEEFLMRDELDSSDATPDDFERVGKKYGRTQKSAAEVYAAMSEIDYDARAGEHQLYSNDDEPPA